MKMNPSSSIVAMSPVTYQPSRMHLGGPLGLVEVARHQVRALDEQQALAADERALAGLLIDDLRRDARHRMADRAGFVPICVLAPCVDVRPFTATTGAISVQP